VLRLEHVSELRFGIKLLGSGWLAGSVKAAPLPPRWFQTNNFLGEQRRSLSTSQNTRSKPTRRSNENHMRRPGSYATGRRIAIIGVPCRSQIRRILWNISEIRPDQDFAVRSRMWENTVRCSSSMALVYAYACGDFKSLVAGTSMSS
jgi:hypothetical protein